MPFGLCNVPAVFQHMMQQILMSINPQTGPTFASAYLDDILIFSESFDDHLHHLCKVIQCFADTGLKFKPSKCHFINQDLEYLGHVITPDEIAPNPAHVSASNGRAPQWATFRPFLRRETVQDISQSLVVA